MDGGADLVVVPAAVLDREDDDQAGDEQREERGDRDHEEVQTASTCPAWTEACLRKERKSS